MNNQELQRVTAITPITHSSSSLALPLMLAVTFGASIVAAVKEPIQPNNLSC
jgi:hypothetical protein